MSGYGHRANRLLRWLVVGPAALAGLLGVVVGGPVLLLWFGGNPFPGEWPTLTELWELLTRPDDGQLLVWVLTVVGWGAWLVIAGSLLLEIGAQLTGAHTPRVPGLGTPQRLAGVLVAGVLAALTAPGISHAHAAPFADPAPVTAPLQPVPEAGEVTAPARPGEVLSGQILPGPHHDPGAAESQRGWAAEYPELRPVAGGAGDSHRPAPVSGEYAPTGLVHQVASGDWMWHIAGRYLGDEERYPEIAALNPQYAQQYADFPDHIRPGDELVLPADAYDRGERDHATGELVGEPEPPGRDDSPEEDPPDPVAPEQSADPDPGPSSGTTPPDHSEPPASSPAAPPQPPSPPGPAPEGGSSQDPPASSPPQQAAPAPFPPPPGLEGPSGGPGGPTATGDPDLGAGADPGDADEAAPLLRPLVTSGVLASVLLGALVLYRWRKLARRRHRRAVSATADGPAEAGLRASATADVARLDRALRVLAAGLAPAAAAARESGVDDPGQARQLPDVGAVWIGDGEIHLILAARCGLEPPAPFGVGGPGSWFLPSAAELPDAAGTVAPLPSLVTIGSQPGQHLLVDLERMGMLTVTGPAGRTSDLLRYLVAELAHNPWSDRVEVTLAGFSPEAAHALAQLGPDRVRVAESVPAAVHELRRRLTHTTGALTGHGLADSVQGRLTDTATDTWLPQLLLIDQPGPEHDELLSALEESFAGAGRRCAVAVVVTARAAAPYGRRSITVTGDGMLKAGFLHDTHALPAVALPSHLLGPLTDLLRDAATGPDHPIPPAPERWAAGADVTGGTAAAGEPAPAELAAPQPVEQPAPAVRAGPTPATPAAPAAGASARQRVLPQPAAAGPARPDPDPDLDTALERWREAAAQPPRIAILGPVHVDAPGTPPGHRLRVCQELIVYLAAVGEQGADAAEIAGKLWPNEQVRPTVRTDVIMNVRRWLGSDPDGRPWLSEAVPDGRYRLGAGVLVDWHLFRRLRARGERRGPAGAEDLRAALALVRGAPLAGTGDPAGAAVRTPYSWLPGSPVAPELVLAGVVDTAHQLVELSVAAGDLATAHWAVRQAWLADPGRADDHPWRDLLRVHLAEGDDHRLREVVTELLRWRDVDHPDELAPATRDLVRALPPFQPAGTGDRR